MKGRGCSKSTKGQKAAYKKANSAGGSLYHQQDPLYTIQIKKRSSVQAAESQSLALGAFL